MSGFQMVKTKFKNQTENFRLASNVLLIKQSLFMPKQSSLANQTQSPDFKWFGYQMVGAGIRYNPNTASGSVLGCLLYLFLFYFKKVNSQH
jgi:hypothetical protein